MMINKARVTREYAMGEAGEVRRSGVQGSKGK